MTDKKPGSLMIPPQGGMMRDFVARLKLIARLMGDRRVNILLKVLPLASVAYLFLPADLIPVVPFLSALDDAAILWVGSTLFVELCPRDVVQEHMKDLSSNLDSDASGDVVDAESTDVDGGKE
ncbi:MAG: DUF1232 domain-containing protein [Chloroflexi bacterium]|nr:DUF1232 domain-containing protein [Chloroflexota bacterium]